MKYAKLVINRVLMILIVLVLLITSFSKNGFYTVSANEQEELFPFRGNKLQNPYLRYGPSDTSIPNWVISSTNNILSGEKRGTISKTSKNGFRDIGMPNYLVGTQNNSDTSTFKSKSYRTSESSSNAAAAFMLFGQTMKLQANREYYFRAEIKSSNGNNDGVLNIYPGDRTSGPNVLASQKYSVGNKMMIVSLPFTPTGDGNVTVSLRHFANAKQDTHLEIHRMGFFLKDDYLIQEEAHALFNDSEFKELVGKDTAEIQKNIDAIRSKITASDNPYAEDVKEYVNGLLNKAQTLLDQAKSIEASIKDTYENFDEKVLKGDVTQDTIDELKKRIEEVSSPGLKEKLNNDLKEVERVYDLQVLKPVLKEELEKKANDAIKEIEDLKNVPESEKQEKIEAIQKELENVKKVIDDAKTREDATDAKDTSSGNIDKIISDVSLVDRKNESKSELDKKAEDAKKEIDKLPNLTDDEKQKAKDDIDQKNQDGKDAIDQSNDPKEIDKVIDTTDKGINDIVEDNKLLDTKNRAKNDLDKKAEDAKKEIDKLPNLTEDEKQKAKDDVDQKTKEGKDAIDQSTTPKDVEDAKNTTDTAVKDIVDQSTLQDAKNKAKKDLEAKADETKKAIDALPGLSQEIKDKAKGEIDNALNNGLENIETGKSIEDVNKVVSETKTEMDAIKDALIKENFESLEKLKDDKKANLNAEAEKAKETIDKLENLSQADKDKAKKVIDQTVNDTSKELDKATTPSDINTIYNQGKTDIGNVVVKAELDDAKIKAVADLKAKADEVRKQIADKPSLSNQQRKEANDEINKTLANATKRIEDTTVITDVPENLKTGIDELDAIEKNYEAKNTSNLDKKKEDSKSELDQKAEDAKKEIDKLPNLTDDEKQKAKDDIDQKNQESKDAIDQLNDPKEIDKVIDTTDKGINDIVDDNKLLDTKNKAKDDLDKKAEDAKKEIDKLPNLTDEEKTKAKEEIEQKNQDGKDAIDQSNDPKEIDKVIDTTDKGINDIVEDNKLLDTKNKAKDDLDKKAEDAKKEIDKLPNLTDDEKQKAKDEIDQKTKDGKDAIDQGSTPKDVENAKNTTDTAVKDIVDQSTLQDAKNKAKKDLETKADETKKAIDALPGLSQEAKDKAKAMIDSILKKGYQSIDSSDYLYEIERYVQNSIKDMHKVLESLNKKESDLGPLGVNDSHTPAIGALIAIFGLAFTLFDRKKYFLKK
ncbi:DUF1542 domain-containing protein [Erysipelothrix rhusiopathiae]|nr:DUF1542 domain-containing protein [Erysipelothrix rhusiopathiae]MDE8113605.1 DUF1542 domain-containing protein [Erysipelothrix rhusiopathiae]